MTRLPIPGSTSASPGRARPPVGLRILAVCLLLCAPSAVWAAAAQEYQVKAAFLLNFVRFAEWPSTAFADAAAPLRIGILGEDPFGAALDGVVLGETVRERPLAVQRARRIEELDGCQVVFIARSEQARAAEILAALGERPVLTVSDLGSFAAAGGVIGFYLDGNRVRFEINAASALRRQVRLSAQLLRLGRPVAPAPEGGK